MRFATIMILSISLSVPKCVAQDNSHDLSKASSDIASLQSQLKTAEANVDRHVTKSFAGKQPGQATPAQAAEHRNQLMKAVRDAFDLQTKLQLAQLADAEAKIAISRQRIATRQTLGKDIVAKRVESLLSVPAQFKSPQAVLEALERFTEAKDFEGCISLLTDDEAKRLSGLLLQGMAMTSAMLAIAEATTDSAVNTGEVQAVMQNAARFMRPNPPPEATAALQQLASFLPAVYYQLGATNSDGTLLEPPRKTLEEYSKTLRDASGVLTDVRAFNASMMKAASMVDESGADKKNIKSNWKVEINGTRAVAIQLARPIDRTTNGTAKIELAVVNGRWRISSLIGDDVLMTFAGGPSASSSLPPVSGQMPAGDATSRTGRPAVPSLRPTLNPPAYAPSETQTSKVELLEWDDFLQQLPEVGTSLVMFSDGSDVSVRMLPVASSVAKAASVEFIELQQSIWGQIITSSTTHFVLMKDRQLVATRSGLLTESRMRKLVALAENYLTPAATGVDPNSLVRIVCYINPGEDKIGSQQGGTFLLTGIVVAQSGDDALVMAPDSIRRYMDKGYACLMAFSDESGKEKLFPFDVVSSAPAEIQGSGERVTYGTTVYHVHGVADLSTVRLAESSSDLNPGDTILSGAVNGQRQMPPIRNFTSPIHWQSQRIEFVESSSSRGDGRGPKTITVRFPTAPAPVGFSFTKSGDLIGGYEVDSGDHLYSVCAPEATRAVLQAAMDNVEDADLKDNLAALLK